MELCDTSRLNNKICDEIESIDRSLQQLDVVQIAISFRMTFIDFTDSAWSLHECSDIRERLGLLYERKFPYE